MNGKKILVIAIRALGDIVLITPVISALKKQNPTDSISVLVDERYADILVNNPNVKKIFTVKREGGVKKSNMIALSKEIRKEKFDLAIDLFSGPRSALLAYLSQAKKRIGEDKRKSLRGYFYNQWVVIPADVTHIAERALFIGGFKEKSELKTGIFLSAEEKAEAKKIFSDSGLMDSDFKIGVFPSSGWHMRNWPVENFIKLFQEIKKKYPAKIILFGGNKDKRVIESISQNNSHPIINFINRPLRKMMALMGQCNLFISNDTGPMHLAVALNIPTIALYGPGDLKKYAPWGQAVVIKKDLPCSPCRQYTKDCKENICMKMITVEDVLAKVDYYYCSISLRISLNAKS